MTQSTGRNSATHDEEVALIVGGGPGVSASCARLFSREGMKVAIAARNPDKPVLQKLESEHGVRCYPCDAREPEAVAKLFRAVNDDLGRPKLVVHNIDGRSMEIFRKDIVEADPVLVLDTLRNSTYSAFLVGQQAAKSMLSSALAIVSMSTPEAKAAPIAARVFSRLNLPHRGIEIVTIPIGVTRSKIVLSCLKSTAVV